jgi:hypothetical protein
VSVVTKSESRDGSRRVFRNWFTAGFYALLLAVDWANWARYVGSELSLALIALASVLLMIMVFRLAIIVTDDRIIVRGWIRTRTESWSNVAGFGFARANPLNRSAVYIEVRLSDGSRVHTPGLTAASKTSKFALRTVTAMEALRPHRDRQQAAI